MWCTEKAEGSENEQPRPKYRTCTDVVWLAIYTIFWLFLIVIAIFSSVYGNPLRVINGYDSYGNTCGVRHNDQYSNFPLSGINTLEKRSLLYYDVKELRKTIKVCVKKCPSKTINNHEEMYKHYSLTNESFCRYDFNMSKLNDPNASNVNNFFSSLGPCPPFPIYASYPVLHRCVPKLNTISKEFRQILNSWDIAQQFLADIYSTWHIIAALCGIAFLFSMVLVCIMHCMSRIISWIICILVTVIISALTFVLWYIYYNLHHQLSDNTKNFALIDFLRNEETLIFILAILATFIMIALIVIIYYIRNKLSALSALFEEAGKCMISLPGLLVAPTIALFVLLIFLAFWVYVVMGIVTASAPEQSSLASFNLSVIEPISTNIAMKNYTNGYDRTVFRVEYTDAKIIRSMLWIYFIGLIWSTEFIFACQQFTLAAAVAYWYFKKPTQMPTVYAISRLVKYHLGTVAKGSFIITLFKIPRLILTYLYAKLKKGKEEGSKCSECCLQCGVCFFWILEKFLRFLNHNAYTVVAIESINFCPAAGIAWNAIATNVLQVSVINSIGDFILFLGKVLVASTCGLLGIFLLQNKEEVHYYIASVILIIVFSFFIAHIVLSLFEMVVDTLFLCVCEDKTINGRGGRWAQSNLARLVGEEPLTIGEEPPIQVVEMMPINKQPFSMTNLVPADMDLDAE